MITVNHPACGDLTSSEYSETEVFILKYGNGTICYILDEENHILTGKISGTAGKDYLVQVIGACGVRKISENEIYLSEEEAAADRHPLAPKVKVQISED